jgi:hypothetical protein
MLHYFQNIFFLFLSIEHNYEIPLAELYILFMSFNGNTPNYFFLFCTFNTVSITLKQVSKSSSFRYWFQEHLLKFSMLVATYSE